MGHQQDVALTERRSLIGSSILRVDSVQKVTGRALYSSEQGFPRMLHGRIKRSPLAAAKITKIDLTKASQVPGVRAIITGKDFKPVPGAFPPLAFSEVIYVNQGIAAVAALTKDAAEEAVEKIEVDYEELPANYDPEQALSLGHIARHMKVRKGDPSQIFRTSDFVVEHKFSTAMEGHFLLERMSFVAQPDTDGGITVVGTTGVPSYLQVILAGTLGLDVHQVRVRVPFLGGWFGGKNEDHTAAVCAKLALACDRPVKVELTREETITDTGVRHPATISIRDGVSKSGRINAREIRAVYNGGAYSSGFLLQNAITAGVSVYDIPNINIDAYVVNTNLISALAKRAPHGTQMVWAIESQMDYLAETLGIDPVQLRLKNILSNGKENAIGEVMDTMSYESCISKVASAIRWRTKEYVQHPWRMGKGLANGAKWGVGGIYQAKIHVRDTGKIEAWVNLIENGQGIYTGITQIVAHEFGIPPEDIILLPLAYGAETATAGFAGGASGSRQLVNVGKAVTLACEDAKKKIANKASAILKVDPESIRIEGRRAINSKNSGQSIAISDLFARPNLLGGYGPPVAVVEGREFVGEATWIQKIATPDPETGSVLGGRLSPSYINVAQAAEVLVNTETGQVKVNRIVAAQDVGKAINPQLVKWQIISCVMMGLSAALSEELIHSDGRILNPNFADYKLLTAMDAPRIEPILIETPDKDTPYGAKPVGEASILPVAAAIRNAVHDAVGVWIDDLPITPEKVLMKMTEAQKNS